MDHDQRMESVWALYDGQLAGAERDAAAEHLAGCAECRRAVERWRGAAQALFRAPEPPSASETEAFVRAVMGRLDPSPAPAETVRWEWLAANWLLPALGLGLAAAFAFILLPRADAVGPADLVLLADGQDTGVSRWVLPPDPSERRDLLDFVGEGR